MAAVCVNDNDSLTLVDIVRDRRAIEHSMFASDNHGIHVHNMTFSRNEREEKRKLMISTNITYF